MRNPYICRMRGRTSPKLARDALQLITSSPAAHDSESRLEVSTSLRSPVSASRFTDIEVRVDSWKAPASVSALCGVCVVFMERSVCGARAPINIQKREKRT